MDDKRESRDPSRDFFRAIAVERYEAWLETDTPELLVRWRPGLVIIAAVAAALTALGAALLA
ncbi:MAG: hypothetical protein ACT4P4_23425 [Betaproteobacteria bacterium]